MAKNNSKLKDKILEKKCINKFFISECKYIMQAGGKKVQSIGAEASLEACEALFKDGTLIMKAFSINDFCVFLKNKKNQFELIYDSAECSCEKGMA